MKDSIKRFFAFRKLASWPRSADEYTIAYIFIMFLITLSMVVGRGYLTLIVPMMSVMYLDYFLQMQVGSILFNVKKSLPIEAKTEVGIGIFPNIIYICWIAVALGLVGGICGFVTFVGKVGRIGDKNYDVESNTEAMGKNSKASLSTG